MTVLNRLKMELSNKQYFTDEQYTQFLTENDLTATDTYDKSTMLKSLLFTVLDVFEAVANDTDLMQSITTEFGTTSSASKWIENRIGQIKDKIAAIPEEEDTYSCFSLMYTRSDRRNYTPADYGNHAITNTEIDNILSE